VLVLLDKAGFQISNSQKAGFVMGADSASINIFSFACNYSLENKSMNLRQKSLPLDAPSRKRIK
jgi:hypothetical protein